jgi:hypothetical protein
LYLPVAIEQDMAAKAGSWQVCGHGVPFLEAPKNQVEDFTHHHHHHSSVFRGFPRKPSSMIWRRQQSSSKM